MQNNNFLTVEELIAMIPENKTIPIETINKLVSDYNAGLIGPSGILYALNKGTN